MACHPEVAYPLPPCITQMRCDHHVIEGYPVLPAEGNSGLTSILIRCAGFQQGQVIYGIYATFIRS